MVPSPFFLSLSIARLFYVIHNLIDQTYQYFLYIFHHFSANEWTHMVLSSWTVLSTQPVPLNIHMLPVLSFSQDSSISWSPSHDDESIDYDEIKRRVKELENLFHWHLNVESFVLSSIRDKWNK